MLANCWTSERGKRPERIHLFRFKRAMRPDDDMNVVGKRRAKRELQSRRNDAERCRPTVVPRSTGGVAFATIAD